MADSKDVPATEVAKKDLEAQSDVNNGTYLHGLKLVLVFIGLALSMFVIILDQTVRSPRAIPFLQAHLQILIPAIPVIASSFDAVDQIGWISSYVFALYSSLRSRRSYFVTQCSSILLWGQALAFFNQKTPLLVGMSSGSTRLIQAKCTSYRHL